MKHHRNFSHSPVVGDRNRVSAGTTRRHYQTQFGVLPLYLASYRFFSALDPRVKADMINDGVARCFIRHRGVYCVYNTPEYGAYLGSPCTACAGPTRSGRRRVAAAQAAHSRYSIFFDCELLAEPLAGDPGSSLPTT